MPSDGPYGSGRLLPVIWIVDDSPLDAQRAHRALTERAVVEVFVDGSAALERLATQTPDVLVLDWVMPGVSGLEVVQFLRSQTGAMAQVQVLLLTSQNQPQQISEGLDAGANDYLAKPYAVEELRARVDALVRSSRLLARVTAAEASARELLINTPDALIAVDDKGAITFVNAEAARILGRELGALTGTPVHEAVPDLPAALKAGSALHDVNLRDRIYSPTVRVLATEDGRVTAVALRDVTERRRSDERRLDFYSMIAHDLRTPLSAMLLRNQSLLRGKKGPVPEGVAAELQKLEASMRSMSGVIDDFLELARFDGTGQKVEREQIPLVSLVDETIDELRPLAEASKLELRRGEALPSAKIFGNRTRLKQVLSNLIGNAIKFTPSGGRVLVTSDEKGEVVELRVSDDGPGIAADKQAALFDRFNRGDATQQTTGWGLGLMIVREIVEAHGGLVGVDSVLGKGASFWVRLPKAA